MCRYEVVIVSYGREKLLVRNHHVLRQLYPTIPVCWGLQGEVSSSLREFAMTDPALRIVYRHEPHITATLNACLRSSSADVVLMLDDDAVPCPGWLEAFAEAFSSCPDLPYCMGREVKLRQHYGLTGSWLRLLTETVFRNCIPSGALSAGRIVGWMTRCGFLFGNFDRAGSCAINSPRGCNLALNRQRVLDLGGFEEAFRGNQWGFETELGLRVQNAGMLGRYCGQAVVLHEQAPSGGTRSNSTWSSLALAMHNHRLVNRHLGVWGWCGAVPRLARTVWQAWRAAM